MGGHYPAACELLPGDEVAAMYALVGSVADDLKFRSSQNHAAKMQRITHDMSNRLQVLRAHLA